MPDLRPAEQIDALIRQRPDKRKPADHTRDQQKLATQSYDASSSVLWGRQQAQRNARAVQGS